MNVSPDFSPPMRVMAPYFIIASFSYLMATVLLFFLNIDVSLRSMQWVGWAHLYLLGFVMMSIFAAMAQLGPVVVEANHRFLGFFHLIWMALSIGLLLMLLGFYITPLWLPFGGILVLLSMVLFAVDFWLTLRQGRRHTSVTASMKASNFFLLFGVVSGFVMALAYRGADIAVAPWYHTHVFSLIGGFVLMLIMGISTVLIPMFGASKRVSDNDFSWSFYTMLSGVLLMMTGSLFELEALRTIALLLMMLSVAHYGYQFVSMLVSRARVEHDVWAYSMYVAVVSLTLAWFFFALYFLGISELLRPGLWLLLVGFIGFMIFGNFYKILPFLVWFERYAPLVETQPVPMLHELINRRMAVVQLVCSTLGLIMTTLALLIRNALLFEMGSAVLVVGALFMLTQVIRVIRQ